MKYNFRLLTEDTNTLIEGMTDADALADIIKEAEKKYSAEDDWDKFKQEVVNGAKKRGIKKMNGYDISDALDEAKPKMEADDGEQNLIRCPKPPTVDETSISSKPSTNQGMMGLNADKDNNDDELEEGGKSDFIKLAKNYAKQAEKEKVNKKNAKVSLDSIKKDMKQKQHSIYIGDVKGEILSGKNTFVDMKKIIKKLLNMARKIEKTSKSNLSIIPVMELGRLQMSMFKDHENATIALALKNGDDLLKMRNELSEAKKVARNVTQFGLANNVKKSGFRLVASLSQPNLIVPERFTTKVVKELSSILGVKRIRQMGRMMYFEVPKWDELKPRLVAQEIFAFLSSEGLLSESILKRDRNKFLISENVFLKEDSEDDDYKKWMDDLSKLSNDLDKADIVIKKASGDSKGGITPDKVRATSKWKKAKSDFDRAMKALQGFNKKSPKDFIKRKNKERRASWAKK